MRTPNIARVYLRGGAVNKLVRTTPGRSVSFVGGMATVQDERDMPHMLKMPNVQVEVETEYLDNLPNWVARCEVGVPPVAPVRASGPGMDDVIVGEPPMYEILRLNEIDPEPKRRKTA